MHVAMRWSSLIKNIVFDLKEGFFQTGLFFGEVEGAVMNKLLQMGSFKRLGHVITGSIKCCFRETLQPG